MGVVFGTLAQATAYANGPFAQVAHEFLLFGWSWAWLGFLAARFAPSAWWPRFVCSLGALWAAVTGFYVYRAAFEPYFLHLDPTHCQSVPARVVDLLLMPGMIWFAAGLVWAALCAAAVSLYRRRVWGRAVIRVGLLMFALQSASARDLPARKPAPCPPGSCPALVGHVTRLAIMTATSLGIVAALVAAVYTTIQLRHQQRLGTSANKIK